MERKRMKGVGDKEGREMEWQEEDAQDGKGEIA